jgi:hypothetical protein
MLMIFEPPVVARRPRRLNSDASLGGRNRARQAVEGACHRDIPIMQLVGMVGTGSKSVSWPNLSGSGPGPLNSLNKLHGKHACAAMVRLLITGRA